MTVIDTDLRTADVAVEPTTTARYRVRVRRPGGTRWSPRFEDHIHVQPSDSVVLDWTQDEALVDSVVSGLPHEPGALAVIERQVLARVTRLEWVDG